LLCASPERILGLGAVPFRSLCALFSIDAPTNIRDFRDRTWPVRLGDRSTLLASTYFPGNNRHKGFDKIVADLRNLLALDF
jgi:hypothetical protein